MTIAFFVVLVALAHLWGRFERQNRKFQQGFIREDLGREGTYRHITICQGITTWLLFATFALGFWLLGWKLALAAVLIALVVAAFSY